jgi:3-hydroxypropionyl-coenzyme A dehydratase
MKYIQIEPLGEVCLLRINRPEALNAMNSEVIAELSRSIDIVGFDDSIKVVIITASSAQGVLNKIEKLDKPVIAAVNGFALGGGCELSMVCDMRIASSNAKIGQPEVTIGIPPGWGGTQRLVKLVGPAKAKELIFTGKMISAQEAYEIGLVNRVVSLGDEDQLPPEIEDKSDPKKEKERAAEIAKILNKKLINECISLAKEITKNGFTAVKVSKTLINKALDTDLDTGLRLEIYGWALCFAHEDRQKMMSAFLNKSKK